MPWMRIERRNTVGEQLAIARESRGLTLRGAVEKLRQPNIFLVRGQLAWEGHPPEKRRLSRTLTDQEIWDAGQAIGTLRLEKWERDLETGHPDALALAICASVYDYPIAFFYHTGDQQEPIVAHVRMHGKYDLCSVCGFLAAFQCDYPLGKGKTCDAHLCQQHAIQQGPATEDRHFCPTHAAIGQAALPLTEE